MASVRRAQFRCRCHPACTRTHKLYVRLPSCHAASSLHTLPSCAARIDVPVSTCMQHMPGPTRPTPHAYAATRPLPNRRSAVRPRRSAVRLRPTQPLAVPMRLHALASVTVTAAIARALPSLGPYSRTRNRNRTPSRGQRHDTSRASAALDHHRRSHAHSRQQRQHARRRHNTSNNAHRHAGGGTSRYGRPLPFGHLHTAGWSVSGAAACTAAACGACGCDELLGCCRGRGGGLGLELGEGDWKNDAPLHRLGWYGSV